jgi:hypothetical protein
MDAEVVGVLFGVGAPEFAEDLAVGDDFAAVDEEEAQEGVFLGGEVDFLASAADEAGGEVDFDIAKGDDGRFVGGAGAAKDGADAGEEFAAAEGFGEVVVGAGVEGGDFVFFAVADGEDEDGDLGPFAEAAEDFEAVEIGEAEVEDDGFGLKGGGFGEAEGAGFGFMDGEAAGLEGEAEEAADLHFVVNDEEARGGSSHSVEVFCGTEWGK